MNPVIQEMRDRLTPLAPEQLEILDESALHAGHAGARAGGGHFKLTLVSPAFAGQSLIARHRLVYQALGDLMTVKIHALSITALAPGER